MEKVFKSKDNNYFVSLIEYLILEQIVRRLKYIQILVISNANQFFLNSHFSIFLTLIIFDFDFFSNISLYIVLIVIAFY
jgi:hypothetical protein